MAIDQFIASSGAWDNALNWSTGAVPGSTDTAEIQAGQNVEIYNNAYDPGGGTQDVSSLTLGSGSSLVTQGGLTVGDTGAGDSLGGIGATITIQPYSDFAAEPYLIAGSGVTSAYGTVYIGHDLDPASYTWSGGGTPSTVTQVVDVGFGNFDYNTQFYGSITDFQESGKIIGPNGSAPSDAFISDTIGTNTISETYDSGTYTLNFTGPVVYNSSNLFVSGTGEITTDNTVPCFASGTMILTPAGEVAVEDLRVGDLVVASSGHHRPIVWVGRRDLRREADGGAIPAPIRVQAGAFGDSRPVRDLWLSANHAVCVNVVEEVLIPIGALVNGATIARVGVDEITYWHVELQSHDVLVADGMPAESYLDCNGRRWFRSDAPVIEPPRRRIDVATHSCRPFFNTGVLIDVVKQQLACRAEALGWRLTSDMDVHLLVDGRRIDPDLIGEEARFQFSPRARDVVLVCETFTPADRVANGDRRRLGVSISRLRIDDHQGRTWDLPMDDPQLTDGFHPEEAAAGLAWRWTDGRLFLPPALWADCLTDVLLYVTYNQEAGRRWIAPAIGAEQAAPERRELRA